jgi:cytochrome P450
MSAYFHEAFLNLAAHPLLWGLARLTRRIKPVCNVPGLGIVVSDAAFAREVLVRDKDFAKNGPGSFAQALTTGLGPIALGNMDGEKHRSLRGALADVTSPARSQALVQNRTDEISAMCFELQSDGVVDIAHFMRGWSGQIAFDLVGIDAPKGAEAQACQDIVRLSARMATVLGFRRPSARQTRDALKDRDRMAAYFHAGYADTAAPESLAGRLQALGFDFEQALGVLLIFVIGGTLTTSAALPRLLALFLDHGVFEQSI